MPLFRRSALVLAVSLAGCAAPDSPTAVPPTPALAAPPAPAPPAAATAETPTPATAGTPENPGTPSDAVRRYYAAIDARDYRAAYALWGDGGEASGQSFDAFAAGFADTRHVTVEVSGDVDGEGGAGSVYATVPVVVHATTAGGEQAFRGTYQVRRVNDVDGATPAQLTWHIASADLKPDR